MDKVRTGVEVDAHLVPVWFARAIVWEAGLVDEGECKGTGCESNVKRQVVVRATSREAKARAPEDC